MKWISFQNSLYNIDQCSKIEFYYDDNHSPYIAIWMKDWREILRGSDIGIAYKNEKEAEEADKNAKLEFYLWIQAVDEWFITFEDLYHVPSKKKTI